MAKKQKNPFPLLYTLLFVALLVIVIAVIVSLSSSQDTAATTEAPKETVPKNEYNDQSFYREDGFLRYRDSEHLLGIDVSAHQGVIDWTAVAATGIDFAIIRIGYRGSTVGELYEDEQFRYNLEEAVNAGLQVGVYFFSQALTPEEAAEEAAYACSLLDGFALSLPIYFDWEFIGGRVESLSDIAMTDCAVAFCEEVEAQGYTAGVYFNQEFGYFYLDMMRLQEYHLWLAEYNETPTFRYHFDCLQFTDSGTIDGIETVVDLNVLFLPEEKTTQ